MTRVVEGSETDLQETEHRCPFPDVEVRLVDRCTGHALTKLELCYCCQLLCQRHSGVLFCGPTLDVGMPRGWFVLLNAQAFCFNVINAHVGARDDSLRLRVADQQLSKPPDSGFGQSRDSQDRQLKISRRFKRPCPDLELAGVKMTALREIPSYDFFRRWIVRESRQQYAIGYLQ